MMPLRSLVRNLPLPALLCSSQGCLIETNISWNDLTGHSASEFPSLDSVVCAGISDDNLLRNQLLEHLLPTRNHGHAGNRPFPWTTKAKGKISLSFGSSVFQNLVLIQAAPASDAAEITRRLLQSESTVNSFYETSPLMMGIVKTSSDDVIFESANPTMARFLEVPVEDFAGLRASRIPVPREYIKTWLEYSDQSERERKAKNFELELKKNGKPVWVAGAVKFLEKAGNGLSRFSFTVLDITERKSCERDRVFIGDVTSATASAADFREAIKIFAFRSLSRLGETCLVDMFENGTLSRIAYASTDPERHAKSETILQKYPLRTDRPHLSIDVTRTGKPVLHSKVPDELLERISYDAEHLELIKIQKYRSIMCVPILANDKILGAASFLTNQPGRTFDEADLALAETLCARVGLALENSRLYTKAKEAAKLQEDFLGIVSHDLQSPLASIRLNAEMLQRMFRTGIGDLSIKQTAVSRIELTVHQMSRLIQQLLDIGRIERGALAVERSCFRISQILETATEMLRPIGLDRSIELTLDLNECDPEFSVYCDRDRVLQIFMNLVSNAFKFSPRGSEVRIRVSTRHDSEVRFSVSNSGPGIPQDHLTRIFERYWQAPECRRQGTGLGLYIAKGIVEAHGGRIWAESNPSCTIFNFTLPKQHSRSVAI